MHRVIEAGPCVTNSSRVRAVQRPVIAKTEERRGQQPPKRAWAAAHVVVEAGLVAELAVGARVDQHVAPCGAAAVRDHLGRQHAPALVERRQRAACAEHGCGGHVRHADIYSMIPSAEQHAAYRMHALPYPCLRSWSGFTLGSLSQPGRATCPRCLLVAWDNSSALQEWYMHLGIADWCRLLLCQNIYASPIWCAQTIRPSAMQEPVLPKSRYPTPSAMRGAPLYPNQQSPVPSGKQEALSTTPTEAPHPCGRGSERHRAHVVQGK